MRTPAKFYMGSPLRKRDMSNMCSKMPHVHVYCSGDARRLTGGLGLHILSVLGACCVCLCWVRAARVRACEALARRCPAFPLV